jgi:hypothetical protein
MWTHNSCDEVLGAALTLPSAQQLEDKTKDAIVIPAKDVFAAFTVPIAGQKTRAELVKFPTTPEDIDKPWDACMMAFPLVQDRDMFTPEKAWSKALCVKMGKTDCSSFNR